MKQELHEERISHRWLGLLPHQIVCLQNHLGDYLKWKATPDHGDLLALAYMTTMEECARVRDCAVACPLDAPHDVNFSVTSDQWADRVIAKPWVRELICALNAGMRFSFTSIPDEDMPPAWPTPPPAEGTRCLFRIEGVDADTIAAASSRLSSMGHTVHSEDPSCECEITVDLRDSGTCTDVQQLLASELVGASRGLYVSVVTYRDTDIFQVPSYVEQFYWAVGGTLEFSYTILKDHGDD